MKNKRNVTSILMAGLVCAAPIAYAGYSNSQTASHFESASETKVLNKTSYLKSQYAKLKNEMGELRMLAEAAPDEVQPRIEEGIQDLNARSEMVGYRIDALPAYSEGQWRSISSDIDRSIQRMREQVDSLANYTFSPEEESERRVLKKGHMRAVDRLVL